MTALTPTRRVAVAVHPRLLADTLRSLLTDGGVDSVVIDRDTSQRFGLALTSDDAPTVIADVTVALRSGPRGTATATVHQLGQPTFSLDGLPTIIDFVRSWAGRTHEGTPSKR